MKTRITLSIFLFFFFSGCGLAQVDVDINPSSFDVAIFEEDVPNFVQLKSTLSNSTDEDFTMAWAMVDIDLPAEWVAFIIDDDIEFFSNVMSSPKFDPIELKANTEAQDFILTVSFFDTEGCGTINIVLTDFNTEEVIDTIKYSIVINEPDCITTNTSSAQISAYTISPNPSKGIFNLSTMAAISNIEIFAMDGKRIQLINQVQDSFVDLSGFSDGLYLIKILDRFGQNHIIQVVKN